MRTTTGFDTVDPTLICRIRVPLDSRSVITLAGVVAMRPDHSVHREGDWLVVREPGAPGRMAASTTATEYLPATRVENDQVVAEGAKGMSRAAAAAADPERRVHARERTTYTDHVTAWRPVEQEDR